MTDRKARMNPAEAGAALVAIVTTVATREQAQAIATDLVERGLAACAQWSPIDSIYRWQGALQHDTEIRLLLKTTAANYAAVEAAIRERHPYELPAIYALAIVDAFDPYADWVRVGATPRMTPR